MENAVIPLSTLFLDNKDQILSKFIEEIDEKLESKVINLQDNLS
jgi:hypothetical protein